MVVFTWLNWSFLTFLGKYKYQTCWFQYAGHQCSSKNAQRAIFRVIFALVLLVSDFKALKTSNWKIWLKRKKDITRLGLTTNFLLKNHLLILNWPSGVPQGPFLKIVVLTSLAQKSKFYKITKNSESSYHSALILLLNPENITTFEKKL